MPRAEPPSGVPPTYSQQYRRCGKPGCTVCWPGLRGHGPYWYAFWRENGHLRSRYLGRQAPQGVTSDPPAVEAPPALRVRTLGSFTAWRGEQQIPHDAWNRRKAADLFTCLLGAPHLRLSREQVLDLLWPDADPASGAASLRAAVHLLRAALDAPARATRAISAAQAPHTCVPTRAACAWFQTQGVSRPATGSTRQRSRRRRRPPYPATTRRPAARRWPSTAASICRSIRTRIGSWCAARSCALSTWP